MDADQAARDRGRMRIAELWRPLPWWERVIYVLAVLLLLLAFLATVLSDHASRSWGEWGAMRRLEDTGILLLAVLFPFGVATGCLAMRRWGPEHWRVFRRSWSVRAVLVGSSVLFGLAGWDSAIGLATPVDRIPPPNLPSFLAVPLCAAAGLLIVGATLALPEMIVRASPARRRRP